MMKATQNSDVERNAPAPNQNLEDVRTQVDDVRNIMADNITRIMERGNRLDDLDSRTEALHASSQNFQTTARTVQRHMCRKNLKWTLLLIAIFALILACILILVLDGAGAFSTSSSKS